MLRCIPGLLHNEWMHAAALLRSQVLVNHPKARAAECIVFLAHHTDGGAMAALAKLADECGSSFAIVPLFDQTKKAFPIDHVPGALSVDCAQVTRQLPYREKHREHPGTFWPRNIELPLMWFFKKNPQYDCYWQMEYDVRFTGHWMEFFRHFAGNQSDLLTTTLFDYNFRPGWGHWKTLKSPQPIPEGDRVRALLSLCRLSNTAMRAVHAAYCAGWSGHYEVTIPTILKTRGLALEDFGGSGRYVAPGNHNRFYRNTPEVSGLSPGTFTIGPTAISADYPPNMLWHPIKG
jgi:hypothetical protein